MAKIKVERITRSINGERGKRDTDFQARVEWELLSHHKSTLLIRTDEGNYVLKVRDLLLIIIDFLLPEILKNKSSLNQP